MNFYITKNVRRCEPECLQKYDYTHIKAKTDGERTIICSESEIDVLGVLSITKEVAQETIDTWIDDENSVEELDIRGNKIEQQKIDLEVFCG
jgi:hypothetical protein